MRRLLPIALAALTAVPVLVTDTPAAGHTLVAPPAGGTHTVTLRTGDGVTVRTRASGCPQVSVRPAPGGGAVSHRCDANGHATVIPASVARLVGTTLDPALFDVTALIADGYDDARMAETPLIVEYAGAVQARATSTFG